MTENELLEALLAALPETATDAVTTTQIAETLRVGQSTALRMMHKLRREGRAEAVRTRIEDVSGRAMHVTGWRIKK